ncbi:protein of unknown function DUF6 transmembrane [Beutenbergia cavernae DSM 12333]|uniref:EamA domain-containing protein n=1 Tax=Beutenbergia cavernae (strain ATCC BAA-8 / DSM 12333 / CCUG 43141 / JCM 11478 / NBRC 16432 / NCIMB 13614 / HKI 0122) TaxID=471853 RepID=C5C295_BEUC1|nr:EamA family transporter [Beutenbergia cavernae]ACQ81720.1 protein of unknown function DUF6 transmembrane [Beutenbergia cavernae DSM 12333]
MTRPTGVADRVPAPALFIAAGVSQYYGAALAIGLFAVTLPTTVAWVRLLVAAVVLLAWKRPWRVAWTRRELLASALFGLVLGGMNLLFYVAIAYLPLGAAVAIEFAGPVALAAWGGRTARARLAIVLAVAGVLAISVVGLEWSSDTHGTALGIAAALAAGASWAVYMVLGRRIAVQRDGTTSLAVGMGVAALVYAAVGAPFVGPLLASWDLALLAVAVGVLSSAVPYAIDQVAMRRLSTPVFALLNALLPATATLVGVISLRQVPSWGEVAGLVAISVAVAITTARPRPVTAAPP